MKNIEFPEQRIQLFRLVVDDPQDLRNLHDRVVPGVDEVKQDVGLGGVVVVDLEGVDVDDGVGDVGQRRSEVVDAFSDSGWTVPHHEPDSLKKRKCPVSNGPRLFYWNNWRSYVFIFCVGLEDLIYPND